MRRAVWAAIAAVSVALALTTMLALPLGARAAGSTVTVDRQAYVSDTPVDPYNNDTAAIHVGVAAGNESSRSFIHLDLSALGSVPVTSLTLTLTPTSDASGNVQSSAASLQACMLTQPLNAPFAPSQPPAYDCSKGASAGTVDSAGSWTFDITSLLATWATNGNTGAAIIPAGTPSASAVWSVAFDRTKSTATAQLAGSSVTTPLFTPPPQMSAPIPYYAPPAPVVTPPAPPASTPSSSATPAPARAVAPPSKPATPRATAAPAPWAVVSAVLTGALLLLLLGLATLRRVDAGTMVGRPRWSLMRSNAAGLGLLPPARGAPTFAAAAMIVALGGTTLAPLTSSLAAQGGATAQASGPSSGSGTSSGAGPSASASSSTVASTGAGGGGGAGGGTTVAAAGTAGTSGGGGNVHLYRGVTPTTVSIGVIDNTDSSQYLGSAGLGAAAVGDGKAQARAAINDINAHGGIAGHTVVPVFHDVPTTDLAANPSAAGQAACSDLAQDQHVFAVVIPISVSDSTTLACFAQHDTPAIVDNSSGYDQQELNQFFDYLYVPAALNITTSSAMMVSQLATAGFTTPTGVYGVVAPDLPEYHNAVNQGLIPALQARGISLKDKVFYSTSGSNSQTDFQNGVVTFESEGINHVFSIGKQSQITFFMVDAEKQQYRPRYALSSLDNPQLLESTAPAAQLSGAIGIGWNPSLDNDTSHSVEPINATAKRCTDDMAANGVSNSTGNAVAAAYDTCDTLFFLQAAIRSSGELTSAGVLQAVGALGTAYAAPNTFVVDMTPNRHDGASAIRDFGYSAGCSCFQYTGGDQARTG